MMPSHVYGPFDLDLSRATANLARVYEGPLFGMLVGVAHVNDSLFLAMEVDPVPANVLTLRRIQTALAGRRVTQTVYLYLGGEDRGLHRPLDGSLIVEIELVTEDGIYTRDALDEIARTSIP